jgi:hypothetical protein
LAVVTGPDVAAVEAKVTEVCAAAGVVPTAITVTPPSSTDPERRVTVEVQTDFVVIPGRILGTFSGTIPLSARSVMRHESV